MHAIDDVFRPLEEMDPKHRREPISVDKLRKGDACWSTRKKILGWIIDTVLMTISLPARRATRLRDILAEIRTDQKRLSMKTYHKLLGELRSMSIALPGSRGLFSALQQALHHKQDGRLRLTKAFHAALDDFRYIHEDLDSRPTRLQEIVPTAPTILGAHDASGIAAGGVIFPDPSATPRNTTVYRLENGRLVGETLKPGHPILWRHLLDPAVSNDLVSWENPTGRINNSELELAGGLLHNEAAVQCFDLRERTMKAATDNLATMYWMRKGSITADSVAADLLRKQGLHQRFHRYVHLIDYLEGDKVVATLDAPVAISFLHDFHLAQEDVTKGVVPSRSVAASKHWSRWCDFCTELDLDPTLQDIEDPIPFLQVFAVRYRNGTVNPSKQPVRSRTVEDAVRSVGQTFKAMGAADPRITHGKTDFRLQRMFAAYKRQDPPPNRVKPIPIQIIRHLAALASTGNDHTRAVADMIIIAFFFLLRPGEYTGTKSDTSPFRLCDVGVFVGSQRCDPTTTPLVTLRNATFVTLEFTTQKNGVRGEVIGLARSGDPQLCPVLAVIRRLIHLREHAASHTSPLATFYHQQQQKLRPVTPTDVTETLRMATTILGPQLGFLPQHVSARSLRAAGAMALLCAHVDTDIIRLLGRWRSDEMLRYLHVQAAPVMRDFAALMLRGGCFTLHPNHEVPIH